MLVAEAELAREFALVVEQQAFLGAAGGHVQGEANPLHQRLRLCQALGFARGDQFLLRQCGKGRRAEQALPQPQDRLRIAQAAGAILQVRFEVVSRVAEASVPIRRSACFAARYVARGHSAESPRIPASPASSASAPAIRRASRRLV